MKLDNSIKLDFNDVLLVPKHSTITSRKDVDLLRSFKFKYNTHKWTGIPIISANMTSVTNGKVVKAMNSRAMLSCLPKNTSCWGYDINTVIPSFGINEQTCPWVNLKFICLDAANGYMEKFVNKVKQFREKYPNSIIIAGNVVTPEMVQTLILAGADIVKVGIGSGAACKTRLVAGVGYPQLSAVIDCADAAHGLGGHVVSDGGCVYPADVVKAFAAGADFVMLGAMLAGHDENGQEFYGMSSERANNEIAGGLKDYKASEGWELKLPPKGTILNTLQEIEGGLRSACAYVGAQKLKDLPKCASFIRVNNQNNKSLLEWRV